MDTGAHSSVVSREPSSKAEWSSPGWASSTPPITLEEPTDSVAFADLVLGNNSDRDDPAPVNAKRAREEPIDSVPFADLVLRNWNDRCDPAPAHAKQAGIQRWRMLEHPASNQRSFRQGSPWFLLSAGADGNRESNLLYTRCKSTIV